MPKRRSLPALILALSLLATGARASDSPQFRGPNRDGVFPGSGLLQAWPEGGPPLLWSASGLGAGFSSVSVVDGQIFTTGMEGGRGFVVALTTDGKAKWKRYYGQIHDGNGYPGARPTPTYDDGLVYIMTSLGEAIALDAGTGEVRWQTKLPSRNITWGITESPLVFDDKAIFTPGGSDATIVALDKKTGEEIWATKGLSDRSAYCSPRLFEDGELRQIVTMTKGHMVGIDPETGDVLWEHDYPGRYDIHAVSPVFAGRSIYVSDGYKQGGKMFELAADGKSVSVKWEDRSLDVHHGGTVLVDGTIYGAASNGTWYALDAASGEAKSSIPRAGKGSVVYADGKLYGYVESGDVLLVDPEGLELVSRFEVSEGRGQHWAHPVVANGVLYVRHGDALMAYDVTAN